MRDVPVLRVKSKSRSVVSDSVRLHGLQPARHLCPWDSPGKKAGVGCRAVTCLKAGLGEGHPVVSAQVTGASASKGAQGSEVEPPGLKEKVPHLRLL